MENSNFVVSQINLTYRLEGVYLYAQLHDKGYFPIYH